MPIDEIRGYDVGDQCSVHSIASRYVIDCPKVSWLWVHRFNPLILLVMVIGLSFGCNPAHKATRPDKIKIGDSPAQFSAQRRDRK